MKGPYAQSQAWVEFDNWSRKLSARFCDEDFDIPLASLVKWFGLNEPMDVTAGRCLDYWIDEVSSWGNETDPNKWDMERLS